MVDYEPTEHEQAQAQDVQAEVDPATQGTKLDPVTQKSKAEDFLKNALESERAKNARLLADNEAIRSEFAQCSSEGEMVETTRKKLGDMMADALTTLNDLLLSGTDGIKLNTSKYIIDKRLSLEKVGSVEAEAAKLTKLLEELGTVGK